VATAADALATEALRVNARYVEEVVVGWNLCPWAARAWQKGEVERRVFADASPDVAKVAAAAAELAALPACAVALLIFPHATASVSTWEAFAERLRRTGGAFLVAPFHPLYRHAAPLPSDAAQLVSLIRRTPDPTLQLVRASLVDVLERGGRDVSAEIARDNFTAVSARTPAALSALLDDIRRDRDEVYRRR